MRVLIVLTSHDQLGNTGRKTGFWLEELAAPYYVFKDAGAEITLASPKGGQPPLDPKSNEPSFQTDQTRRFEAEAAALLPKWQRPAHAIGARRDGHRHAVDAYLAAHDANVLWRHRAHALEQRDVRRPVGPRRSLRLLPLVM
jgi:putative intracellular protease/amidase